MSCDQPKARVHWNSREGLSRSQARKAKATRVAGRPELDGPSGVSWCGTGIGLSDALGRRWKRGVLGVLAAAADSRAAAGASKPVNQEATPAPGRGRLAGGATCTVTINSTQAVTGGRTAISYRRPAEGCCITQYANPIDRIHSQFYLDISHGPWSSLAGDSMQARSNALLLKWGAVCSILQAIYTS